MDWSCRYPGALWRLPFLGRSIGLCSFLLLIPMAAKFVIQGINGCVELLATDCRRVSLKVLADDGWRDRRRGSDHSDVMARSADVAVGLKNLSRYWIDIRCRRDWLYAFKALSFPAGFLVRLACPVAPPAVGFDDFFAVCLARSSALVAISDATCRAVK